MKPETKKQLIECLELNREILQKYGRMLQEKTSPNDMLGLQLCKELLDELEQLRLNINILK